MTKRRSKSPEQTFKVSQEDLAGYYSKYLPAYQPGGGNSAYKKTPYKSSLAHTSGLGSIAEIFNFGKYKGSLKGNNTPKVNKSDYQTTTITNDYDDNMYFDLGNYMNRDKNTKEGDIWKTYNSAMSKGIYGLDGKGHSGMQNYFDDRSEHYYDDEGNPLFSERIYNDKTGNVLYKNPTGPRTEWDLFEDNVDEKTSFNVTGPNANIESYNTYTENNIPYDPSNPNAHTETVIETPSSQTINSGGDGNPDDDNTVIEDDTELSEQEIINREWERSQNLRYGGALPSFQDGGSDWANVAKWGIKAVKPFLSGAASTALAIPSMMLSAHSAYAEPVVDATTGVNRFTGNQDYTPFGQTPSWGGGTGNVNVADVNQQLSAAMAPKLQRGGSLTQYQPGGSSPDLSAPELTSINDWGLITGEGDNWNNSYGPYNMSEEERVGYEADLFEKIGEESPLYSEVDEKRREENRKWLEADAERRGVNDPIEIEEEDDPEWNQDFLDKQEGSFNENSVQTEWNGDNWWDKTKTKTGFYADKIREGVVNSPVFNIGVNALDKVHDIATGANVVLDGIAKTQSDYDKTGGVTFTDSKGTYASADLDGLKGSFDQNTGLLRPNDKVVSKFAKYGKELRRAQEGDETTGSGYDPIFITPGSPLPEWNVPNIYAEMPYGAPYGAPPVTDPNEGTVIELGPTPPLQEPIEEEVDNEELQKTFDDAGIKRSLPKGKTKVKKEKNGTITPDLKIPLAPNDKEKLDKHTARVALTLDDEIFEMTERVRLQQENPLLSADVIERMTEYNTYNNNYGSNRTTSNTVNIPQMQEGGEEGSVNPSVSLQEFMQMAKPGISYGEDYINKAMLSLGSGSSNKGQGVIKPHVPSNYFPRIRRNPNFMQSGDKGSLMPFEMDWEGKWQNDLGLYDEQNYMIPGLDVETGEWGDKPYTTNFMNEWNRSGLEPTFTFTSAGGPGAGFRGYFPYSDPLGIGLEVDLDPTGPGGGILVNTGNLRKWSNNLADKIGDNSVGNSFRDLNLPPGFLYGGVEVAGNVPAPFLGATVSLNDTENLEKWLQLPENEGKSNFSRGFMHALGPGLHAWNMPSKLSGQMTINNPFNVMGDPLWKSPDLFGGRKIHNPFSGTGVGIGGRTGLKGGNIIPHIEIGAFEQGVRGGFASIKEEVAELAEDLMKKNKNLSQSQAMKKAYSETAGSINTGKIFEKLKIPKVLDYAGELVYGAPGSGVTAPYQKSGNTLANYLKNSKIPYGKFINNPWFWKTIARGLMVPDILNTFTGAMHQENQPISDSWEGVFGEDKRNHSMEKYGAFPRMQRFWHEGIDPILGAKWWKSDAEERNDNMTMMNDLYDKAFMKKYDVTKEQIKDKELELQEKNNWDNAYDLELLKEAEKNSPAEVTKAENKIKKQKESERAKMHSYNPYLAPKYKQGGQVVDINEQLLQELRAAGADITIL